MRKVCAAILLLLAAISSAPAQSRLLFEDFEPPDHQAPQVWRMSARPHPLIEPYRGSNQDQTARIVEIDGNQFMRVEIGPSPGPRNAEWTVQIMGNEPVYPYPDGFLAYWAKGPFQPAVNRMSFWFRCSVDLPAKPPGAQNFNIGTYVKPNIPGTPAGQGIHYYHYWSMPIHAGRWIYMEMNDVPTIQLDGGSSANRVADPSYWNPHFAERKHYFESLTRIYLSMAQYKQGNYSCDLDDLYFSTDAEEPSGWVKSLSVTHNGAAYEVGWDGAKNVSTVHEVRYSVQGSIKARGWSQATPGGTTTNPGSTYAGTLWTSPSMPEDPVCFAIKPRMNILGLTAHGTPQNEILATLADSAPLKSGETVLVQGAAMAQANGAWNVVPKICAWGEGAGERRCLWRTLPQGQETLRSFYVSPAGLASVETSTAHGLFPGQWVFVRGPLQMNAHKNFLVTATPSPTTFVLDISKQGLPTGERISGGSGWLLREVDAFWLAGSRGPAGQWSQAGGTLTTTAEQGAFAEICYTPRGVAPPEPCDVNCDFSLDAADIELASSAAAGLGPCLADLDGDGICDANDVAWLTNAVRLGSCGSRPSRPAGAISVRRRPG